MWAVLAMAVVAGCGRTPIKAYYWQNDASLASFFFSRFHKLLAWRTISRGYAQNFSAFAIAHELFKRANYNGNCCVWIVIRPDDFNDHAAWQLHRLTSHSQL